MTTRALALLGLALASSACIDASPNLHVAGICGIPEDAATCKAPTGTCPNFLNGAVQVYGGVLLEDPSDPTLTITVVYPVTQVAEIVNQALNNSDTGSGRVNGKNALVEYARISYSAPGFAVADAEVRSLFTPVPSAGKATIFLPIMSAATVMEITGFTGANEVVEVLAQVRLGGHYVDGTAFETSLFDVPVFVRDQIFDGRNDCTDPAQVRLFCYAPGQGRETCAAP